MRLREFTLVQKDAVKLLARSPEHAMRKWRGTRGYVVLPGAEYINERTGKSLIRRQVLERHDAPGNDNLEPDKWKLTPAGLEALEEYRNGR